MKRLMAHVLIVVGCTAMFVGALDPLEGSVVILAGCGLVLVGVFLDANLRTLVPYWVRVFLLMALGVGAMFALSVFGGVGGTSGRSFLWALLLLPYPVAWIMGVVGIVRLARLPRRPR